MRRLRPAEVLSGAAGGALLVVEFLPWYGVRGVPAAIAVFTGHGTPYAPLPEPTAWQAVSVVDILLALCALVAIALVVVTATASGPAKPVAFTVLSTVAATLAVLLALWRLLDPPKGYYTRHYGVWLGLAVTGLMLVFSFRA